jgi:sporulation protein YlmC with PRC-barrel domain
MGFAALNPSYQSHPGYGPEPQRRAPRLLEGWFAREGLMRSHDVIIASAAALAVLVSAAVSAQDPSARRATTGMASEAPAARAGDVAATVLDQQDVQGILGRQVLSSAGQDMGRVIDIVVDRGGQVRAAVIDFGGFLGVGNRKVAVDWNALRFAPTGSKYDRITLELTREQVSAAPEYKDGRPLVVLGAAAGLPPSRY